MKQETDHEEVVLTRWQKLKHWWEIASTIRKFYRLILALFIGTSGTMAIGEITNTTPLRDAAVEVGIVDPDFTPKEYTEHEHNWNHEHPHEHPVHEHADHVHADHVHPELIDFPVNHSARH